MAKFYVECGPIQVVLSAETAEQAALAAIDRSLEMHRWTYDDPGLSDQDRRDHLMLEALLHLEPSIRVSQRGFGRADATLVGTPETVDRWHRLMTAVSRLLDAAGLPPKALVAAHGRGGSASGRIRPRLPR